MCQKWEKQITEKGCDCCPRIPEEVNTMEEKNIILAKNNIDIRRNGIYWPQVDLAWKPQKISSPRRPEVVVQPSRRSRLHAEGDQVLKDFMWRNWKGDTLLQEQSSSTMSLLFSRVAPESLNNPLDLIVGFQRTGQSLLFAYLNIRGGDLGDSLILMHRTDFTLLWIPGPGIQSGDVPGTLASVM